MALNFGPRPPLLREALARPAADLTPATLSFLPGPWLVATLAQRTSSPHNRGAWEPSQPLLGVDGGAAASSHELRVVGGGGEGGEGGDIVVSQALPLADPRTQVAELQAPLSRQLAPAAAALHAARDRIEPLAARIRALSVEPAARATPADLAALAAEVRALRAELAVPDDGVWLSVVGWPVSAAARLALGVGIWERTERDVCEAEARAGAALAAVRDAGGAFPGTPLPASLGHALLPCLLTLMGGAPAARPPFLGRPAGALALFYKADGGLCFFEGGAVGAARARRGRGARPRRRGARAGAAPVRAALARRGQPLPVRRKAVPQAAPGSGGGAACGRWRGAVRGC